MRKITLLFLLLISMMLQSCVMLIAAPIAKGKLKKNLTVKNHAIPPDVGLKDTYIMCILTGRNSRDKYLRKNFAKEYKGKYVFVTESEAISEKYSDVDKYRYIFTFTRYAGSVKTTTTVTGGGMKNSNTSTVTTHASNYFMIDRKTNTEYNSKYSSSFYGKYILAYAMNLEKQRIVNKNRKV